MVVKAAPRRPYRTVLAPVDFFCMVAARHLTDPLCQSAGPREALVRLQEVATDVGLSMTQWRPLVAFGNPPNFILEQEE